ncbi:heterokaryon incompatibility protein-domain-containing protein [Rhypophila decipiens]|uniref:Heterokaryon incompatibility protein-domain-containing protein n=1 Tax=Rhypophila decipiens TaxID=261697 RepID=A0AAN7BAQ7_9PEZI|nr:heterokaryon incompatibility protein-domain-containing protein [Rhypophila decipiens]
MDAIGAKNAFQATVRLISDLRPYLTSRRTIVSAALSMTAAGVYALCRFPISAILALIDSRHLSFLVVLSLIICYRSVTRPAAAHGALSEGRNGIWSPMTLHALRIFFNPEPHVQWFGYMLYFKWFCGPEPPGPWVLMSGSETVTMEGMLMGTATWYFGYSPITAHIIYLVTNLVIHPLRQRLTRTGKVATPIWRAQFSGFVWFLLMHALISSTAQRIKATSESFLGPNPHRLYAWQMTGSEIMPLIWKAFVQYFKPRCKRKLGRGRSEDDQIRFPFQHEPITTPNTIRLLRVLPSLDNTKPIHCEILTGRFDRTDSVRVYSGPKYTAISYCWDKAPNTEDTLPTILINSRPYQVQQTVCCILRTVRRPLSEYNTWIDSICINQSDDLEKAKQVQLMRLIYENANHVAGFLRGPSNTDPGGRWETTWRDLGDFFSPCRSNSSEYRAREMLGRITSTMHIHNHNHHGSSSDPFQVVDPCLATAPEKDWLALQTLLTNPYFTRIWIIQEVVAARQINLNYGGQIIPWQLFARAMAILSCQGFAARLSMYFRHNNFKSLKPIELPGIFNGLVLENLRHLEDTLKLCGRFEASREVDRVFALLGVARDSDVLRIKVDYRREKARDVFVGVARVLMVKRILEMVDGDGGGDIYSVLRFAGVVDSDGKKPSGIMEGGLPSWVPDWTRRMDTALLTHARKECQYRVCGSMCFGGYKKKTLKDCGVKFMKNDRLLLKGVPVTRVEWVSPVFTGYPEEKEDKEESQRQFYSALVTTTLHLSMKYGLKYRYRPRRSSEPELVADAFWRTLFGDMSAHARPGDLNLMKGIGSLIVKSEIAILRRKNADLRSFLLKRGTTEDGGDAGDAGVDGKVALQLNDNADNIFNHMLITELANANPKHKGGFTQILGTKKIQQTAFEHPIFALGRRVCITADGHVGLVPAAAKERDLIVISEGAPTPHVLRESRREVKKKDGSISKIREHRLVGECYVHGIMDGEAVDGKDVKSRHILLW